MEGEGEWQRGLEGAVLLREYRGAAGVRSVHKVRGVAGLRNIRVAGVGSGQGHARLNAGLLVVGGTALVEVGGEGAWRWVHVAHELVVYGVGNGLVRAVTRQVGVVSVEGVPLRCAHLRLGPNGEVDRLGVHVAPSQHCGVHGVSSDGAGPARADKIFVVEEVHILIPFQPRD